MGPEAYCYEWMDNREQVVELIARMRRVYRETYAIAAKDPFEIVNQGGNPTPEIIGRDGYRDYYMREYADAYEVIHPAGKLLGTHLDGRNGPIMDLIAQAKLDYIEAYDPVMSPGVKEATDIFGDKLLSLHFPSAWQMHDELVISRAERRMPRRFSILGPVDVALQVLDAHAHREGFRLHVHVRPLQHAKRIAR